MAIWHQLEGTESRAVQVEAAVEEAVEAAIRSTTTASQTGLEVVVEVVVAACRELLARVEKVVEVPWQSIHTLET